MTRRSWIATAGGALAASGAAFYAGRRVGRATPPRLNRLTFRRGVVTSARFTPGGGTVYSARWEGAPSQIFAAHALSIPPAVLASISRHGELAVILEGSSNLARVSPGGGPAREVQRNVIAADWSPDGANFMTVRVAGSKQHIEFPVGKVIYETDNRISMARVSPDGLRVAFFENSPDVSLKVIEPGGAARTLASRWREGVGLAWSTGAREIWFSATGDNNPPAIHAADMSGKVRPILQLTQGAVVCDVSADGRVLFTAHDRRAAMVCQRPGETAPQDLSWGDHSMASDLSADGSLILFGESQQASVYVRKTDGSPAVLLGQGEPLGLSPDGQWAAILNPASPRELRIVPAHGGDARILKPDHFTYAGARWFPDGRQLLVWGNEDDRMRRHYVQDVAGGPPRAITPAGSARDAAIAPDGQDVAAHSGPGIFLFPVEGGQPEAVRGLDRDARPVAWSEDGRFLYVRRGSVVDLVDWKTGKSEVWKDLTPPDPAGVVRIGPVSITPDGRGCVYSYERDLSDLYLAEGLR